MYERHWQLTRTPFRAQAAPEFFCPAPGHLSILRKLQFVLVQRQSAVALIGPTGCGKSFLLRVLETQLPVDIGPVMTLNFPILKPVELVRYLTLELAEATGSAVADPAGLDEWFHAWEKTLKGCMDHGRMPVLIVDDAHLIEDGAVWQTWQLLLAHRERVGQNFSVVFAGQPELLGRLQRLPQLEERLAMICPLLPLSPEETLDYVTHRLAVAGRTDAVFDAEAMQALWEHSAGTPRRIDRLCDYSLLVGYAEGLTIITADQIHGVARELSGRVAA